MLFEDEFGKLLTLEEFDNLSYSEISTREIHFVEKIDENKLLKMIRQGVS